MKNDPYILSSFLKAREMEKAEPDGTHPFITISRQVGALGEEVAYRTCEIMTEKSKGQHPWIVVDKDLGKRVIADHHLPERISKFFSGEQTLSISDHIDVLFGLSVQRDVMVKSMATTVIQMARIGHVIFVGRAAQVIAAGFPRAVHVRIIGSLGRRVTRVAQSNSFSEKAAASQIKAIESGRRHFVSSYFHADLEDSSRYDMLLNTDRFSVENCAHIIANAVSKSHLGDVEALRLRELRDLVLNFV